MRSLLPRVWMILGLVAWMFAAQALRIHDLDLLSTVTEACEQDDGAPHAHSDDPHHCGLDDLQLSSRDNPGLRLAYHFSRHLFLQDLVPQQVNASRPPLSYAPKQGPPRRDLRPT